MDMDVQKEAMIEVMGFLRRKPVTWLQVERTGETPSASESRNQ